MTVATDGVTNRASMSGLASAACRDLVKERRPLSFHWKVSKTSINMDLGESLRNAEVEVERAVSLLPPGTSLNSA